MVSKIENRFKPDYAVPPGVTLAETLEALGMSQADLAKRTGRPKKTINEIIKGKAALTPETALQLEHVLGIPASFWNNLERHYQETRARLQEQKHLEKHTDWLEQIPLKAMLKRGWIKAAKDKVQQLEEVCKFFGVASPDQWLKLRSTAIAFRKSAAFQSDPGAVVAWLRKGELEALQMDCAPYHARKFKNLLSDLRSLTIEPPEVFAPRLAQLCAQAGVAVVFVPELPKTSVSGATRWLTPNKALIQLSLRYKADDHLWFTFFHEAGHIILHGKRDVFLEGGDAHGDKEHEANKFAADTLIPPAELAQFVKGGDYGEAAIRHLASKVGIAPGIVAGRLQHEGKLEWNECNDLKVRLTWAKAT
jgi:addiction module HigA family antidote